MARRFFTRPARQAAVLLAAGLLGLASGGCRSVRERPPNPEQCCMPAEPARPLPSQAPERPSEPPPPPQVVPARAGGLGEWLGEKLAGLLPGRPTSIAGMTLPSARYGGQPPVYVRAAEPSPAPVLQGPAGPATTGQPVGAGTGSVISSGPSPLPPSTTCPPPVPSGTGTRVPLAPPGLVPYTSPAALLGTPSGPTQYDIASAASPAALVPAAPTAVKLTVGNVSKGTLLLYTIGEDGKLTFVRELPHGDAFDQKAPAGQRWVAMHADKRAGESFVVPASGGTWLLR